MRKGQSKTIWLVVALTAGVIGIALLVAAYNNLLDVGVSKALELQR